MNTYIVVNPNAGGGRLSRSWKRHEGFLRELLGDLEVVFTESAGDGCAKARQAAEAGADRVISVGGDGTHHEVVNGLLEARPHPHPHPHSEAEAGASAEPPMIFGALPAGTGGDFCRAWEGGRDLEAVAKSFVDATPRPFDLGLVRYRTDDGAEASRHFVNLASCGLAGLVDRMANRSSKRMGGTVTFFVATFRAVLDYTPCRVRVTVDGEERGEYVISNICVGNSRYAGGGMLLAPHAEVDDGLLDVTIFESKSKLHTLALAPRLYAGRYEDHPGIHEFRGREIVVEELEGVAWLDVDGEAPGRGPMSFEVVPGALRLLNRQVSEPTSA